MKQKHDTRSVHNQVVALFQSHTPCGQCTNCLDSAVRRVFEPDEAVPGACRHLWAVLSARHFEADATAWVGNTVRNIMSHVAIAEAA